MAFEVKACSSCAAPVIWTTTHKGKKMPGDAEPRRCRKPAPRYRDLARRSAARRRRNALSAVLGLTSCPTFVAGLWAVGDGWGTGWGAAGVVLAIGLLKASDRTGGWMP